MMPKIIKYEVGLRISLSVWSFDFSELLWKFFHYILLDFRVA